MAGAGYKLFNTGDVLTAAQVNTYLQEQVVMVFANATARTTALSGVLAEGMMSYLQDTNSVEVYNGSAWVSVGSTGDITGVTAGTGISGGGTSGDVTITNSMATAIDAKGDLVVGTGADTFSRLAVGSNNQVLTADSTTATGLKWAAASSGSTFVGCSLKKASGSTQTISTATYTKITFNAEVYDTDGFHDNATNNTRITIPSGKAGKYLLTGKAELEANGSGTLRQILFYKNNSIVFYQFSPPSATLRFASDITYVFDAAVGDYFELALYQDRGANLEAYDGDYGTVFEVSYLGA